MSKMISTVQVLFILINAVCVFGLLKRNVLYARGSGAESNSASGKIACAAAKADPSFVAIRIQDSTGVCEGLTWDWGSSPQYEAGYSYFEKKRTEEKYDPPLLLDVMTQWLIPGKFGVGGRLDIHMTPTPDSNVYNIILMSTIAETYQVYDSVPEVLLVLMQAKRDGNHVYFKSWSPQVWWKNLGMDSPYNFTEGVTSKVSVVPDAPAKLKILFDNREVISYDALASPEEAKQLRFEFGSGNTLRINSIIFIGFNNVHAVTPRKLFPMDSPKGQSASQRTWDRHIGQLGGIFTTSFKRSPKIADKIENFAAAINY